jgi:hypothetical protein
MSSKNKGPLTYTEAWRCIRAVEGPGNWSWNREQTWRARRLEGRSRQALIQDLAGRNPTMTRDEVAFAVWLAT